MTPQVTVLMPIRDGEPYLGGAIESVFRQSFADWELLVVDDGSADRTPELLAEYCKREQRMRVIRLPREGLVATLNRGVAEARAPLVARLDADDIAHSDRLRLQLARMQADPKLVLLGSWAEVIDPDGKVVSHWRPKADPDELRNSLRRNNPFIHSSVLYRTQVVRDVGLYRAAFEAAEDYDLWLRLAAVGTIANIAEILITYRLFPATRAKLLRQAFSLRLAQRCDAFRERGEPDPASRLTAPPDWFATTPQTDFCRRDLDIFRTLAAADTAIANDPAAAISTFKRLQSLVPELNRNERKLALTTTATFLKSRPFGAHTLPLLALLIQLRLPPQRKT